MSTFFLVSLITFSSRKLSADPFKLFFKNLLLFFREGKPQPDNFEGRAAGKLVSVSDPIGLTVEGLQEWHDEACLAVLNNHFRDGMFKCCINSKYMPTFKST